MPSPNPNLHVAAGNSGSVTIQDTGTVLDVTSWTLTESRDMAEVTHSGSGGYKQRKATVRDWTATVELPWNDTKSPENKGYKVGAEVTVSFELADSGKSRTGPAIVNQIGWKVDQTDAVRLTLGLLANGALSDPA